MLDAETKARIDSARDILVGKVPDPKSQVEQITIALIYKFMDDMDRQSEELGGKAAFFSGEFKRYAWNHLLDNRHSGHERLLLYAEGIEKMNTVTTGVKVPDFTGLQMYLKLGTRLAVNGLQLHSTRPCERTMIAFGPRCPSGD